MTSSLARSAAIGAVAGLRTVLAPAALSWAARSGALDLRRTPFFFLGKPVSAPIFSLIAAGELVADQVPSGPSRLVPVQFGARLFSGAFCGAVLRSAAPWSGALAGAAGAALGATAGYAVRTRLARLFGADRPAALIEDATAIAGAILLARARR